VRRPDLRIEPLRGNVNTRLRKLDEGVYDAIILAAAGLIRLEFSERIRSFIAPEDSLPAIGQGAIGIECRVDDDRVHALIAPLHHDATAEQVTAERALNARLNGGCQVPIAGHAIHRNGELYLRGLVGMPDGSKLMRSEISGPLPSSTATVTWRDTPPPGPEQLRRNSVVDSMGPTSAEPDTALLPDQPPEASQDWALLADQDRRTSSPAGTEDREAENDRVGTGSAPPSGSSSGSAGSGPERLLPLLPLQAARDRVKTATVSLLDASRIRPSESISSRTTRTTQRRASIPGGWGVQACESS